MAELPPPWIQTPPSGWLGLLGIKSGGRQPAHTSVDLTTTLEMAPYYLAGGRLPIGNLVATAVGGNGGTTAPITVPQGKVWCLESVQAFSSALGAVANVKARIIILGVNGAGQFLGPETSIGLTGEVQACSYEAYRVLLPGSQIAVFTTFPAAVTAYTWTIRVWGSEVAS